MTRSRTTYLVFAAIAIALCYSGYSYFFSGDDAPSSLGDDVSTQVPVASPSLAQAPRSEQPVEAAGHALDPMLDFARDILKHMETDVRDYTAIMVKRERIRGQLGAESKMAIKVRNRVVEENGTRGLATYLKFLEPPSVAGREVIWVEDEHDGNLISHEAGFKNWKRFTLDPHGFLAMLGNKYPITEMGLNRMVEKLIEKGEQDRAVGDCVVDIVEDQRIGDRSCRMIQVTHPHPGTEKKFDFHIAQIFIDSERLIPLRYAAFLWPGEPGEPPPLEEEYTYFDVQLNVGLTDSDFDPDNPGYDFP